jgi:hypothetical protein
MSELLDMLLKDWLERRAAAGRAPRPDLEAAAVITVAAHAVGELRRLCDLWGLRLDRPAHRRPGARRAGAGRDHRARRASVT